jgi:Tfp pilus assembly protein FimV
MQRLFAAACVSLALSGAALAQANNPLDPGAASSPPGPGCAVGTSGCFPSAPPGPVTQPTDPGATGFEPPPVVDPKDVPFYGELPGPAGSIEQRLLRPDVAQKVREEEQRAEQQQVRDQLQQQTTELRKQTELLEAQREELAAQREELAAEREQAREQAAEPAQPVQPNGSAAPADRR